MNGMRGFEAPQCSLPPAQGSSSDADRLSVPLIGGNAIKQPGADGDPMINAEPSWS